MVAHKDTPELVCTAHKNHARILGPVKMNMSHMFEPSARSEWIKSSISMVQEFYLDGLYFDYELPISRNQKALNQAYTSYVAEVREALHTAVRGSKLVVCTAWSPDNIDGRDYDYRGLANAADYLFVMNYDTQSAIFDRCLASANAPLAKAERGIDRYLDLGISPSKLIFGLPWYGYDYPCLNGTMPDADFCPIHPSPFRGVNCTDAAGTERPYSEIMAQLERKNQTTPARWDSATESPYFNYQTPSGEVHQLWFDNPRSLRLKYALAAQYGLKGVGFYSTPYLDPWGNATGEQNPHGAEQTKAMWDAVDAFLAPPGGWVLSAPGYSDYIV